MRHIFAIVLTTFLMVPAWAGAEDAAPATPSATPAQPAQPAMPADTTAAAPAAAPAQPAAAKTPAQPAPPADAVARAVFTSGVQDHEPVDSFTKLSDDHDKVYFFTELHGLAGHTITHRWIYQGKVKADVTFQVKGERWRVWSSKRLEPSWTGTWQVDVLDQDGTVLDSTTFDYIPVTESP